MHLPEPLRLLARDSESTLPISPRLVSAGLLAGSVLLFLVTESLHLMDPEHAQALVLLLQLIAVAGLLLDSWCSWLGRWFTVIALVALVLLMDMWLSVVGVDAFFVVLIALATGVVGLPGATVVTLSITLLLLGPARSVTSATSSSALLVDLVAIWGVLGVMYAAHRPIESLGRWVWEQFKLTQRILNDARDRQSELQQALADLKLANRQLGLANERTASLRLAAEEARRAKAEFVARVSHEFRTPLNMIVGLVGLMVETEVYAEDLSPDLRNDLEIVHRNSEHLCNMINDVLDLSRSEAGHLTMHREYSDLAGIIHDALTAVSPLVERKGLTLQVQIPEDLPPIYCDSTRIGQVLLNLVSNAARLTEKGGLTVHAALREQQVVVGITDTGPGISQKDAVRIFEPFYQTPSSLWHQRSGSGLGLAISKQCVELHGGRIWLESEPCVGSTFYFQLPISVSAEHITTPQQWIRGDWIWHEPAFRGARTGSDQLAKPRVVICDTAGGLYPALTHYSEEIELVNTQDLDAAIQEVKQCPVHALLLNNERIDDSWLLAERASRQLPGTAIIGCAVPSLVPPAVAAGACGYLTKPITRGALEQALRMIATPLGRVLLVNDDPEVLQLLVRMLQSYDSSLEVVTALTARDALGELRLSRADLVLLDIRLPDLNGWQVLAAMRQDEMLQDIPVLFVSAHDPTEQPPTSPFLLATTCQGISVSKLLRSSLSISALLLQPD